MAHLFGEDKRIEKLTSKVRQANLQITGLQKEIMSRNTDIFFLKEKSKLRKLEHANRLDEKKITKLQVKAEKLEQKIAMRSKKNLAFKNKKGIKQMGDIEIEIAARKIFIEGCMQQMSTAIKQRENTK